ncbi:MAG: hypothetical protein WC612_02685 [Bdellovibrionales bacterium]|jgi:hypothetical protein
MKAVTLLLATAVLLVGLSSPAAARPDDRRGDMFYSKNWIYDRPSVPSDRNHGQDMIKPVPLFYHRNADMFDRIRRPVFFGGDDMFPHIIAPHPIPVHTLKMDPRPAQLEQALYLYR